MTIAYDEMNEGQKQRCDMAMSVISEWLNTFHRGLNETWVNEKGERVPVEVTRDSFFEYNDPPKLLLDNGELKEADTYYRIMVFSLNPYHDEGGPNELTCYFDEPGTTWSLTEEVELVRADQLFDTSFTTMYERGKLVNAYEPAEEEVE